MLPSLSSHQWSAHHHACLCDPQKQQLRQQYLRQYEVESVIRKAIDSQLKKAPLRLINTSTGRLCNRAVQINAFVESTEYEELLTSSDILGPVQMKLIKEAVAKYFSWVMLSHRWGAGVTRHSGQGHIRLESGRKHGKIAEVLQSRTRCGASLGSIPCLSGIGTQRSPLSIYRMSRLCQSRAGSQTAFGTREDGPFRSSSLLTFSVVVLFCAFIAFVFGLVSVVQFFQQRQLSAFALPSMAVIAGISQGLRNSREHHHFHCDVLVTAFSTLSRHAPGVFENFSMLFVGRGLGLIWRILAQETILGSSPDSHTPGFTPILSWDCDTLGESAGTRPLHIFNRTSTEDTQMPAGAPALAHTFFREHPAVFAAPNSLIRRIAGITSNTDDVAGNVLVVKHEQGEEA
ncbi:hypothetical protein DFJ58DRAFT_733639 [Suillus subalutaceus]|uniref:uncharacterized protein n=1 Tax=Suillus subalutaceus TaxID=48586 RepID=UPI001B85CDAD|nr:uncharacterized protein DFJ58DRAFT_733639 [Suillus subalutaceus]KAG1838816.1 hypothetical protein DFJ58DRAFT_733639 [Suillus subalutaceus]